MQYTHEEKRSHKMFLKALKKKGKMSFQDIMDLHVLTENRNTVTCLLDELVTDNLIRKENRDTWKKGQKLWHVITPKGERWLLETETENLKEACRTIQEVTESMSKPENIWRWRKEGTYVPSEEAFERGYLTSEETAELFEHKEKVFSGLRHAFVDLTRVLLKVEGPINVQDDLSNVTVKFINGHPHPVVHS